MKSLRRYNLKNTFYFLTLVTQNREKLLLKEPDLFWNCWSGIDFKAWVILPDHFHVIMYVADYDLSQIIHQFKIKYSKIYRQRYRPGRIWQNRFWDHIIRNQTDMNRHIDYIHYNPVKHGLTNDPFTYEYSSLKEWYKNGFYQRDWGCKEKLIFEGQYGE